MMYWVNFLHIYQPPIQKPRILAQVVHESYRPLFAALLDRPEAKVVLNINGVLAEMLDTHGHRDVLDMLRLLSEKGQVELTASAKYHPFLPTLPESEIVRQIKINDETNRFYFGESYRPAGFFMPEMVYTPEVGKLIHSLGYRWILVNQTAIPDLYDQGTIYETSEGLVLVVRDYNASMAIITGNNAQTILVEQFNDGEGSYCVTGMDGEIFGHHKPDHIQLLTDLYASSSLQSVTASELIERVATKVTIEPVRSSWDSLDRVSDQPFLRWQDPTNVIHDFQVELMNLAIAAVQIETEQRGEDAPARKLLDVGLHSCQLWWASSTPWWSLEMIEQGAYQLRGAIQACETASAETKAQAQNIYYNIITTGFDWQRTGHVDERGAGKPS
jgi:hypothetical protein